MPSLDHLRPAASDSFQRASALLRHPPSRPQGRPRALLLGLVLAASIGACSYPVESEQTVGYTLSWTTYGTVEIGNYTVAALDSLVPPPQRLAIETRRAEAPSVPADHRYPPGARWTRVRYSLHGLDAEHADQLADSIRAVMGVYGLSVEPIVHASRLPLVAATAGRLGLGVNPGDDSVSDHELQTFIDDQLERLDLPPHEMEVMFPPTVDRLPDGRRFLRYGSDDGFGLVLTPATRLWIRPDHPSQRFTVDGVHELVYGEGGRWTTF